VRILTTSLPFLTLSFQDIWNAYIFTAYASLALYVVIILFGAPFIEYVCIYSPALPSTTRHSPTRVCLPGLYHIALLASLLAIYAIFLPAYVLGPPRLGLPLLSASTGDAVVQNDHWVRVLQSAISSHPSRCIAWLHHRCLARARHEHTLVFLPTQIG
jgi:hypothetical protein